MNFISLLFALARYMRTCVHIATRWFFICKHKREAKNLCMLIKINWWNFHFPQFFIYFSCSLLSVSKTRSNTVCSLQNFHRFFSINENRAASKSHWNLAEMESFRKEIFGRGRTEKRFQNSQEILNDPSSFNFLHQNFISTFKRNRN